MERRSGRGRPSASSPDQGKSPAVGGRRSSTGARGGESSEREQEIVTSPDVPEVGNEEIVLNRRGTPARARKKNRFYFDEEVMVTDTGKKGPKTGPRKVKSEPLDMEDQPEVITGDLHEYTVGEEVEIPAAAEEEVVTTPAPTKRIGRPSKKSGEMMPPARQSKGRDSTTPKKADQAKTPAKVGGRTPSDKGSGRGRAEFRRSRDSRDEEFESRPSKTPERGGRGMRGESRGKSSEPMPPMPTLKPAPKIKKEPGASSSADSMEQNQKYMDKKEKERTERERERALKKKKEEILLKVSERNSDSDYLAMKNKGRREPSPTDFTASLLHASSAMDEYNKQTINKKTAQDISLRLRNLLKLPKAHKWVCYEWFYSNIDKVLFEGENDFQTCLRESFPMLKARKLTRVEWCKIRRIMGKPRRCSQAFFDEEREELGRRRQKIRMIQQRKITDFNYKELPDEIPLQLTIGTKVTARLRRPQDGLFTGTIEGVDTSNNTYRITFDRAGLGTHSIPDYEVLSNDPVETVSTSSFALKIPRRSFGFGTAAFKFQNPGLIGEDGLYRFPTSPFPEGGMLGGFPIRLLDMIVRLSKLLKVKREKILQLKELNVEAEKMLSYGKPFNTDYRLRYARCVCDLDLMNREMAMYVEGIQTYCLEQIAPDHGANQMIVPEQVQDQCKQEAQLIVETYNSKNNRRAASDPKTIGLINNLTSLMLQIKTLSSGERNLYELKSMKDTIKETKASLEGKNLQLFQNKIEIPMNRIQAGLCIYTKSF